MEQKGYGELQPGGADAAGSATGGPRQGAPSRPAGVGSARFVAIVASVYTLLIFLGASADALSPAGALAGLVLGILPAVAMYIAARAIVGFCLAHQGALR